jgi:hypothetical protein
MHSTTEIATATSVGQVIDFLQKIQYAQGSSPRLHTVLGLTMQAPSNDSVNIAAVQVSPLVLSFMLEALESWVYSVE